MGISFIAQTVMNNYSGQEDDGESSASTNGGHRGQEYSYEEAVAKQEEEGGPRRYFDQGEGLDDETARITDENDAPIKSATGYQRDNY